MEQKKFEYNENNYGGNMSGSCCSLEQMQPQTMMYSQPQESMMCPPIHECPQERVCHRYMCYEVPHIMPCNAKIINHHVYRHTYTPCYTTCEENVVSNVYDRNCCF